MPSPILPTNPRPVSYELRSITKTVVSDAVSGKRITRQVGGQRWEASIRFPPMTPAQFGALNAFLNSQGGRHGEFYVEVPVMTGAGGGEAGNFVNMNNDTKLHQVTDPETLAVYPAARVGGGAVLGDVSASSELITNGTFSSDLTGWILDLGGQSGSIVQDAGSLKMTQDATTSAAVTASQAIVTVPGKRYQISANVGTATGGTRIDVGTTARGNDVQTGTVGAARTIKQEFIATSAVTYVTLIDTQPAGSVSTWDVVSVKEAKVFMKCSLARDVQVTRFDADGMVRVEIDVVERL